MDSMEVNKTFGAVLVAGIAFLGSGLLADALVRPKRLEHTVLKIEGAQEQQPAGATMAQQEPEGPPIAVLLASANAGAGEADTKKLCVSCHSFNQGGKAGVGPNLYGVVGAPHGHMEGFAYSNAIKSKQGPWTFDELNDWLKSPRTYAPGTKMSFAGIANDKQRADVIEYLRSLSPNPEAKPAPPPAGATPAAATDNAPASGVTRPQQGRVVGGGNAGAGTTPQTSGQQMSQPSPSQSSPQTEQNQSQQNPNAGGSAVQGQQMSQPSPSQSSPQTEQNQAQQSPDAAPAPAGK